MGKTGAKDIQIYQWSLVLIYVIIFIVTAASSLIIYSKLVTPQKYLVFCFGVYFSGIFSQKIDVIYTLIYSAIALTIIVLSIVERQCIGLAGASPINKKFNFNIDRMLLMLTILTLPALYTQYYLIEISGGLSNYFFNLNNRVIDLRGLGHITVFRRSLPVINAVMIVLCLLYRERLTLIAKLLLFINILLVISVGLASGSRGSTVSFILTAVILINVYKKQYKLYSITAYAVIIISCIAFLGFVRNLRNGSINDLLSNSRNFSWSEVQLFSYGFKPIEKFLNISNFDYQYGLTYLSALTNFIPRVLWPEKLDTGGVHFTKLIAKDEYTGSSNYSTGFFVESIINFGPFIGTIFGFILLSIVFLPTIKLLKLLHTNEKGLFTQVRFAVWYTYLFIVPGGFLFGEFTSMAMAMIIKVFFLEVIILFLKITNGGQIRC